MTDEMMREELDEWLFNGIGDDIFWRPEYKSLVDFAKKEKIREDFIPAYVLGILEGRWESSQKIERLRSYLLYSLSGASALLVLVAALVSWLSLG